MGAGGRRLERRLSLGDYKKAVPWSKYLVAPPGAKIWGGGEELWSADLSKLQIRVRFASGRYGRVYSGRYNGREVAIKMVSQPEEDATLAAELERQFAFEVALLLRLRHHNIVSPLAVYLFTSKASKLMNDEPRQAKEPWSLDTLQYFDAGRINPSRYQRMWRRYFHSVAQLKAYFGISGGYKLLNLVDHFQRRGLYRSVFLSIMEGEESLRKLSPEVVVKDLAVRSTVSLLPQIILFHGTSACSMSSAESVVLKRIYSYTKERHILIYFFRGDSGGARARAGRRRGGHRAAAAAAALMLCGDEAHKFMNRPRLGRGDFARMMDPRSRQIYLTFPADNTFREEDVSNYFRQGLMLPRKLAQMQLLMGALERAMIRFDYVLEWSSDASRERPLPGLLLLSSSWLAGHQRHRAGRGLLPT